MKVLFIGDIVGRLGRAAVAELLPKLRKEHSLDVIIANGENAAAGVGITKKIYDDFTDLGINVITTGNHIWDRKDILDDINSCSNLIRPANYASAEIPGVGYKIFKTKDGIKYAVINLIGRVFMPCVECPFKFANEIVEKLKSETPIIIIDFHGEATSEKNALAWYLDGKISALIGTHTHVQTADERILPQGTALITDAGMVGAYNSIIGVVKETIIKRFLTCIPMHFEPEKSGPAVFNGLVIDIDEKTGKAKEVKRIFKVLEDISC